MYLNRNLIHYQVEQFQSKESCVIMEKVVYFVSHIFKIVNELIIKLDLSEHILSKIYIYKFYIFLKSLKFKNHKDPVNFLNLPFGIDGSEKWFIELWNYTLVPFLNDLIKMKIMTRNKNNFLKHQNDESLKLLDTSYVSDWVVNNYVWHKNVNKTNNSICTVNQRLFRLKSFNEIISGSIRISSSSDDLEIQATENNCSNKHLVSVKKCVILFYFFKLKYTTFKISMLNRLQKAAQQNQNSPKDDTSSGCFDSSNSSNSHSPKSESPTNIPILNFQESQYLNDQNFMDPNKHIRPLLMTKISAKNSKIESAL